jgi:hypothetical protein
MNTSSCRQPWQQFGRPFLLFGWLLIAAAGVVGCNKSARDVSARGKRPAPPIDYDGLDFGKLEEIQKQEWQIAQGLTNDDAGVHFAWAGLMTNLMAVRREMSSQAKALPDILNLSTITNASQRKVSDQFSNRRKQANEYGRAVDDWKNALKGLESRYGNELLKWDVSGGRCTAELQKLHNIMTDQIHPFSLNQRLAIEGRICDAERQIASEYNYAVNSMESYYIYREADAQNARLRQPAGQVPTRALPWESQNASRANPITFDAWEKFQERIAKIEKLRQTADSLRPEPLNTPRTEASASR